MKNWSIAKSYNDTTDYEYLIYYPPVSSCAYDEHENDVHFIGDSEGCDT